MKYLLSREKRPPMSDSKFHLEKFYQLTKRW